MATTFIGGGNMATALIGGMLARGAAAADFSVVEPSPDARSRLGAQYVGAGLFGECTGEAVAGAELVVLAVKPQQMRDAARSLAPHLAGAPGPVVLSIAAGIRLVGPRALVERLRPARASDAEHSGADRQGNLGRIRGGLRRRSRPLACFVGAGRRRRADLGRRRGRPRCRHGRFRERTRVRVLLPGSARSRGDGARHRARGGAPPRAVDVRRSRSRWRSRAEPSPRRCARK